MKFIKQAAIGLTTVAIFIGAPAVAADMVLKVPPMPAPPPEWSWTGCYAGADGGGLRAHKTWTNAIGTQVANQNVDGGLGGLQAGCDYQVPGHVVIGLQGGYDWTNATASSANTTTTHIYDTHITSLASVTGRVGYAFNRVLGYVKGGGAWERDGYATAILATGNIDAISSATRAGWTLGAGGEYAFTDFISGFVEYDYYNFGTRTDAFNDPIGGGTINYAIKEAKNVIRAGLNLRWGGTAPVAAR